MIINRYRLIIVLALCHFSGAVYADPPEVTVEQSGTQPDPASTLPVNFTAVFSEPVLGFDDDTNLTFSGTAPGTLTGVVTEIAPNDGTTYNIAVSGATGSGTIQVAVNAGAANATGGANEPNNASTSVDNMVTYDVTPPTINSLTPADDDTGVSASLSQLQLVFNEDVQLNPNAVDSNNDRIRIRIGGTDDIAIDKTSTALSISANVVTIDVSSIPYSFSGNTSYSIQTGPEVFQDLAGNNFGGITDDNSWGFATSAAGITAPSLSVCDNGQFIALGDIIIAEGAADDFADGPGQVTFVLGFNNGGFVFQSGTGSVSVTPSGAANNDIDDINISVSFTSVTLSYTLDGTNDDVESITISGLRVSSDGSQPSANIIRTGGTANINGNNGTGGSSQIHGTITSAAAPPSPIVNFPNNNYCEGETITSSPNVTGNNNNVRWYNDAALTSEITAVAGNNNPTAAALGFSTNTPGAYHVYVTQTVSCESEATPVTLTVIDGPDTPFLSSDASGNEACLGDDVTFSANPAGASNYTFIIDDGGTETEIDNGSSPIYTTNGLLDGYEVRVRYTNGAGCYKESNIISMTMVDLNVTFTPSQTAFAWDEAPYTLNEGSADVTPDNFQYSGLGVYEDGSNNYVFDPGAFEGSAQNVDITYSAELGSCSQEAIASFTIYDPNESIQNLQEVYCDEVTYGNQALQYPASTLPSNNSVSGTYPYVTETNIERQYYTITGSGITSSNTGPSATHTFNPGTAKGIEGVNNPFEITLWVEETTTIIFYYFGSPISSSTNTNIIKWLGAETEIRQLSAPTFILTDDADQEIIQSEFCNVEDVVYLAGTPAGGIFSGAGVSQPIPGEYIFDPSSFTGADITGFGPRAVPVTYTYTDVAGCQSYTVRNLQIYETPGAPNASNIEACFAGSNPLVTVSGETGATFTWYSDGGLTTEVGSGNTFDTGTTGATSQIYFVTQTLNGCEGPAKQVFYNIRSTPEPLISNLNTTLCENDGLEAFNLTAPAGVDVEEFYINEVLQTPFTNNPTIDPGILGAGYDTLRYYVADDYGSIICSADTSVVILISPSPELSIDIINSDEFICKTEGLIELQGNQPSGSFSGVTSDVDNALLNTGNGRASFDPSYFEIDPNSTYTVAFEYEDVSSSCSNTVLVDLNILPDYDLDYSIANQRICEGEAIELRSLISPQPDTAKVDLDMIGWDFGDGQTLPISPASDIIPEGTHEGATTGTYSDPIHVFSGVGTFTIQLSGISDDGCEVLYNTENVVVKEFPQPDFSWANVCLSNPVIFNAFLDNEILPESDIASWSWDLGDGETANGKNIQHTYENPGKYTITLEVVTTNSNNAAEGCPATFTKEIYIVPDYGLNESNENSYNLNFNTDAGGWLTGGVNSSWTLGTPNGILEGDASEDGAGMAWKTSNANDTYNSSEKSWVHSPCFDFTNMAHPVFQMDIWYTTAQGLAGAVLQYNLTDATENDDSWQTLGAVNNGLNWYNASGIQGRPGNQSSGANVGWTGIITEPEEGLWTTAAYNLDFLAGQPSVRFRIAFGNVEIEAQEDQGGFAFDNIFIGERSRVVLLENFTNLSNAANSASHNQYFKNFIGPRSELAALQYHVSFPGNDPVNEENVGDPNARAAFYGINEAPTVRLDGDFEPGTISSWLPSSYDQATLKPSPVEINIETTNETENSIDVSAVINVKTALDANTIVHIAVVEELVTSVEAPNGESEFTFVVRKMLPSAAGTKFEEPLMENEQIVVNGSWTNPSFFDGADAAVVVFLQNENTKEVYQAETHENVDVPGAVTAVATENFGQEIRLYPNPANESVKLELGNNIKRSGGLVIYDTFGKVVYSKRITDNAKLTIDTRDFAQGLYHIEFEAANGPPIRRRFMIVHQQ